MFSLTVYASSPNHAQLTSPAFAVPPSPGLVGQPFPSQAWFLEPAANPLGVVTSPSIRYTIGSGHKEPGATAWCTGWGVGAVQSGTYDPIVVTIRLN